MRLWPWRPKCHDDSAQTITGATIVTIECLDKSACRAREQSMLALMQENEDLRRRLNEPEHKQ